MKSFYTKPVFPNLLRSRYNQPDRHWDWLCNVYQESEGVRRLWIAVITQAILDAISTKRRGEEVHYKHEAICWLTGGSKHFRIVCDYAGLEPNWVRRHAKRVIYDPHPWRAEPTKGKRYLERKEYRKRKAKVTQSEEKTAARIIELECV
jgi:hypothetical protein